MDPSRRDYIMSGGSPTETSSLRVAAYIRLRAPRGAWMYAPDQSYGSDLRKINRRSTTTTENREVETASARALQPIANDGRASTISVSTVARDRNGVSLDVEIADARGEIETIKLDGLGV